MTRWILGFGASALFGVAVSCGGTSDDGGGGSSDAGPDSTTADSGTSETGVAADTGARGDSASPSEGGDAMGCPVDWLCGSQACPVVGLDPYKLSSGVHVCDQCISQKCCAPTTTCFGDGTSAGRSSPLVVECMSLDLCYQSCVLNGAVDAGGCKAHCQEQFAGDAGDAGIVSVWQAFYDCVYTNCSNYPPTYEDGGVVCPPYEKLPL
jgi:hypothetical protein